MAAKTLSAKVLHVAKTTAEWTAETSIIPKGLLCVEFAIEDNVNVTKLKVGDSVNTFADLPYASGGEVDLSDYYTKEETDKAITDAISGIFVIKGRVDTTDELPMSGNQNGWVYLVGAEDSGNFAEYYWKDTYWDFLGTTVQIDLSDYYTKEAVNGLLDAKVDVETYNAKVSVIEGRLDTIEGDYLKSTDTLILNCTL